jgi:hypothetical protein
LQPPTYNLGKQLNQSVFRHDINEYHTYGKAHVKGEVILNSILYIQEI